MQGKLEINLDPSSISFESETSRNGFRQFRYCQRNEIHNLLVDLHAFTVSDKLPKEECLVRISGDFPADILAKYGLLELSYKDHPIISLIAS